MTSKEKDERIEKLEKALKIYQSKTFLFEASESHKKMEFIYHNTSIGLEPEEYKLLKELEDE